MASNKKKKAASTRERDSKGRFVKKGAKPQEEEAIDVDSVDADAPAQPEPPPPPKQNWDFYTNSTRKEDPKKSKVGLGDPVPNPRAAYAGAEAADFIRDVMTAEYTPPEWITKTAANEKKEFNLYLRKRLRLDRKRFYDEALSANMLQLALGVFVLVATNIYTTIAPTFNLPMGQYSSRGFNGTTGTIYFQEIKEGSNIGGYTVTSAYGERTHPVDGTVKMHDGVDLGTPEGTKVYGIGSEGTVECKEDPNGFGTYALVRPKNLPYEFLYGHLKKCQPGRYIPSMNLIGKTGNSGKSTAPHLHFGMYNKFDGKAIPPTEGYLAWSINGSPPAPHGNEKAQKAWGGLAGFAEAIANQESGGKTDVVNEIGATGKYQFIPSTVAMVASQCIGRNISMEEFKNDSNLQDQIAKCYWEPEFKKVEQETSNPNEQCRMMAAFHYSGDRRLWNSTSPQGSAPDGTPYPSIANYTLSVCKGVGGQ